ncbi:unnamed protein product, partial [Amoebophrya sp. A25]|eukprot:GSA25T00017640001.1
MVVAFFDQLFCRNPCSHGCARGPHGLGAGSRTTVFKEILQPGTKSLSLLDPQWFETPWGTVEKDALRQFVGTERPLKIHIGKWATESHLLALASSLRAADFSPRELVLTTAALSDQTAGALLNSLKFSTKSTTILRVLVVAHPRRNGVSDEFMRSVARVFPGLETLALFGTLIGDASCDALARMYIARREKEETRSGSALDKQEHRGQKSDHSTIRDDENNEDHHGRVSFEVDGRENIASSCGLDMPEDTAKTIREFVRCRTTFEDDGTESEAACSSRASSYVIEAHKTPVPPSRPRRSSVDQSRQLIPQLRRLVLVGKEISACGLDALVSGILEGYDSPLGTSRSRGCTRSSLETLIVGGNQFGDGPAVERFLAACLSLPRLKTLGLLNYAIGDPTLCWLGKHLTSLKDGPAASTVEELVLLCGRAGRAGFEALATSMGDIDMNSSKYGRRRHIMLDASKYNDLVNSTTASEVEGVNQGDSSSGSKTTCNKYRDVAGKRFLDQGGIHTDLARSVAASTPLSRLILVSGEAADEVLPSAVHLAQTVQHCEIVCAKATNLGMDAANLHDWRNSFGSPKIRNDMRHYLETNFFEHVFCASKNAFPLPSGDGEPPRLLSGSRATMTPTRRACRGHG